MIRGLDLEFRGAHLSTGMYPGAWNPCPTLPVLSYFRSPCLGTAAWFWLVAGGPSRQLLAPGPPFRHICLFLWGHRGRVRAKQEPKLRVVSGSPWLLYGECGPQEPQRYGEVPCVGGPVSALWTPCRRSYGGSAGGEVRTRMLKEKASPGTPGPALIPPPPCGLQEPRRAGSVHTVSESAVRWPPTGVCEAGLGPRAWRPAPPQLPVSTPPARSWLSTSTSSAGATKDDDRITPRTPTARAPAG